MFSVPISTNKCIVAVTKVSHNDTILFHRKVFLQKLWIEGVKWDDWPPPLLQQELEEIRKNCTFVEILKTHLTIFWILWCVCKVLCRMWSLPAKHFLFHLRRSMAIRGNPVSNNVAQFELVKNIVKGAHTWWRTDQLSVRYWH